MHLNSYKSILLRLLISLKKRLFKLRIIASLVSYLIEKPVFKQVCV